ncbi:F-box protein [Thraustotheca clavata]|uniref:F-box protein n=1 Tax=Thraustotheca clavata TaxID=74557 RepID=A0A1V9Z240_9STRA|nr:F-box protein [Thraustotheca clavata]
MTRRAKENRQKRIAQRLANDTPEERERQRKWQELLEMIDSSAARKAQAKKTALPEVLSWKSSHAIVAASSKFDLPVRVEYEHSELAFEFNIKDMDIVFSVGFIDAVSGLERYVITPTRCAAYENAVKGVHEIHGPGLLTLTWDNEYSWINQKEISYNVELHQQVPDLQSPIDPSHDILINELSSRQILYQEKSKQIQELQDTIASHENAIQSIQDQLQALQLELAEATEQVQTASSDLQQVNKQVDLLENEINALSWRKLSMPILEHILSFGDQNDRQQWTRVNKMWHRIVQELD